MERRKTPAFQTELSGYLDYDSNDFFYRNNLLDRMLLFGQAVGFEKSVLSLPVFIDADLTVFGALPVQAVR